MEDFSGVSSTFRRFSIGIMKTEQLLKLGLLAVQEDKRKLDELYNKIDMQVSQQTSLPHPGNEGGDPQEDESAFEVISHTNETVTLKMGEKTANLILEALRRQQKFTDELNFHLHNILLVSIWSAFETYLQGVLSEIYQHRPHLLASERKLNYSELIENRADILKYMIDTEIGDFGSGLSRTCRNT